MEISRRTMLAGLSAMIAAPAHGEPAAKNNLKSEGGRFAVLDKSAALDMSPTSGSLKESVPKKQELIWHRMEAAEDEVFRLTELSVGLLRSEAGGEVTMTFACKISSHGYKSAEGLKLNAIIRTNKGVALHAADFSIPIKCTDKDQTVPPLKQDIPKEVAANVFTNAASVEIVHYLEPSSPGLKIERCG